MEKEILEMVPDGTPGNVPTVFKGPEDENYQEAVRLIYEKRDEIKQSFIVIGGCLNCIKEHKWYLKEGYRNICDYADGMFHMSPSETSRYIRIWQRFSKGGDSLELDEAYEKYGVSQLSEMLPVSDNDLSEFDAGMKVAQIRAKKKEILGRHSGIEKWEDSPDDVPQDGEQPAADEGPDVQYADFQPAVPRLKNKDERERWLEDVESWGLWYEDRNIGARYYKYDFNDGSRLIAVRYDPCPPYTEEQPAQPQEQADSTYDGETEYHMLFSDWYLERHSDIYPQGKYRNFNRVIVETAQLVKFLKELQQWERDHSFDTEGEYIPNEYIMKEFDPDHMEQTESFVGRKYAEFYQEHGYIPKNFNAKDCREITDYAPTLATGCGTAASIGSILFFDAVKEAAAVINNEELDLERSLFMIKKIIRIAEPQERRKVKELLDTYGFTMADTD